MQDYLAQLANYSKTLLRSELPLLDGIFPAMESSRGEALRSARKALRLTQQQVADKIGVTRAAVGQWENDEPISFPNLKAVCAALGIDVVAAVEGKVVKAYSKDEIPQGTDRQVMPKFNNYMQDDPELYDDDYFIKKNLIPVYFMSESNNFAPNGNSLLSEAPILLAPRFEGSPHDNTLYCVGQTKNVMEPIFEPGLSLYASAGKIPTIGDYVIAQIKFDRKYLPGKRPTGILQLPVYFGKLEEFTKSSIIISQLNPKAHHEVPLSTISAIHWVMPPE
ncbi:helix-turn-helix transcriptional regulator [Methylobacterium sp. 77]|uniref:helix-turn-helix transcriptional regulator n=1 Tax=Methylobacterium sp. 77 TaxID=1101192 RepID=UPI0009DB9E76|nr:helix-turn-helix transcriptional regulator [Methylobacterium sp. 77]